MRVTVTSPISQSEETESSNAKFSVILYGPYCSNGALNLGIKVFEVWSALPDTSTGDQQRAK